MSARRQRSSLTEHTSPRRGPQVYNQAIQDARKFVMERLDDLEGELWEPEP